jgi:predicted Holliday junction resolvase-like endonuclease
MTIFFLHAGVGVSMSDRIREIGEELQCLARKRQKLEAELKNLQKEKVEKQLSRLRHVSRDLQETAKAWRARMITRDEIQHLWDLLWAGKDDYFTVNGRPVDQIIFDMLQDCEDCMAEIYFDLKNSHFVGPFRYDSSDEQEKATQWRNSDLAFCAFAK